MDIQRTENEAGVSLGAAPKPSALRVAKLRAAHQLLDRPLVFADALALKILGPAEEESLRDNLWRLDTPRLKALRASLVIRSRLAEEEWALAKARGVRQYVLLGAGLETFAYRTPDQEGERIFEVDLPATQQWKRHGLRAAGLREPGSLTFVPVDFETTTLADGLGQTFFNPSEPAFFSWLGVTMYLEELAILETLRFIASLAPGSGLVFDYGVLPELLTVIERAGVEFLADRGAVHGERWKTYFDPALLVEKLGSLGFNEVQDLGAEQLNNRYLSGRADGLRKSRLSRLICARV